MKELLNRLSSKNERPILYYAYIIGTGLFILLYLWANFCNRQVFNLDMYSDAQVAKLMWEQKTLFPENWVFGNQYYVVATPVLSALFYGLCKDSILAMGLASTVMMFLQLILFVWMIRPYVSKTSAAAGLFAIGGAVILGTSVCNCTTGMQLLYTMASYYACYMMGILLALGIYLRLRENMTVSKVIIAAALILCFGLGVQSVRETLVLIAPLVAVELMTLLLGQKDRRKNLKRSGFVAAITAANILGLILSASVPAVSNKSISGLNIPRSVAQLGINARDSFNDFISITGLPYLEHSIKWKPLFLLAVLICAVTVVALCMAGAAILKKKREPLGFMILFCAISLCAVFGVGALLGFQLRTIYYFVWFLLAALSFLYVIEKLRNNVLKNLLMLALLGCGAVNLFYNAYPDFVQHKSQQELFYGTAQKLEEAGIDCTYVEYTTYGSSAVAACSNDKIDSAIVRLVAESENDYCFKAYPHLVDMTLFEENRKENAVLILTDARMIGTSSFATLDSYPGSREMLEEKFELMSVESNEYFDLYIYKIIDPAAIIP